MQMQMQTIKTRGEPFEVSLEGPADAPVLVLSNSLGTDAGLWDQQVAALRGAWRVLRYNQRGHHPQSGAAGDFTLAQLGEDALELLDALGLDRVSWCGISMGGVIGQWLALNAPQRLQRVVLANTAAYLGPPSRWQERMDAVKADGTAAIACPSMQRWLTAGFQAAHPETVQRLKDQVLRTPAACYLGCAAALRDLDLREQVQAIALPVLVVGGVHDVATPFADAEFLHQRIAGSRLVALEAAHLSNIEQADAFNEALRGFLQG
jgi:3-oxoadipate enol-lactonase